MKSKGIKISIILPNYNSEKYLERCIESFLEQDYADKELVIVDGKSKDSSHAIIERFCTNHENIHWIRERDTCVTDGFNIGVKYATGDFIGFMAADSVYYDPSVFQEIKKIAEKIDVHCIYFNAYSYFLADRKIILRNCNFPFTRDSFLNVGCFIPFENIIFKKDIFEKHQLDVKYNLSSDIEFYLRILQDKPVSIFINKASTVNFYDGENLSAVHSEKQVEEWIKVDIKSLFPYDITQTDKFKLHSSIVLGNYIVSRHFVRQAGDWLAELLQANKATGFYSEEAFISRFYPYWLTLLLAARKYGLSTFLLFIRSPLTQKANLPKIQKIKFFLGCMFKPLFPK